MRPGKNSGADADMGKAPLISGSLFSFSVETPSAPSGAFSVSDSPERGANHNASFVVRLASVRLGACLTVIVAKRESSRVPSCTDTRFLPRAEGLYGATFESIPLSVFSVARSRGEGKGKMVEFFPSCENPSRPRAS